MFSLVPAEKNLEVYERGHPTKCYITGYHAETTVGEISTVILRTLNIDNQPCKVHPNSIQCEFTYERTSTTAPCKIERREQNQYKISYQTTIKGRHQLYIKVEGQHIRGSPFPVTVEKIGGWCKTWTVDWTVDWTLDWNLDCTFWL